MNVPRCAECGTACKACKATRSTEERRRSVEQHIPDRVPHGTKSTYTNWACRCDPCREASAEYQRQYRQRYSEPRREERRRIAEERREERRRFNCELRDAWLAGATLEEIGQQHGVTREAIRRRIKAVDPQAAATVKARRRAESERRRSIERAARKATRSIERADTCITCDAPTVRLHKKATYTTCGSDCQRIFLDLRNHLRGEKHVHGFIRPGSKADAAAIEAWERRLPIFERLPRLVRDQITGAVPRVASYHGIPIDATHGLAATYERGCRCPDCREANAKRHRLARQSRAAGDTPEWREHGLYATYVNWGCRCDRCRDANRVHQADGRARRKAAS